MRCFIALPLPDAAKAACEAAIATLRPRAPDTKWATREKMHLTLKFLGNVPREDVARLERALARMAAHHAPFGLRTGTLGAFHRSRQPRVLWLSLEGELEALARLHADVEEVCAGLGLARETRPYAPHVTLGRVRAGAGKVAPDWLADLAAPAEVAWRAEEVRLLESHLHPSGAVYKTLAICSLVSDPSLEQPEATS